MNKKLYLIFIFLFVFSFGFASAENIGLYKVNQTMQITNYCENGECTFMNLTSIEMPNNTIIYPLASMTRIEQTFNYTYVPDQIGQYSFVTCGDPTISVCDKDTFDVSYDGKEHLVWIDIAILLFFIGLLLGYVWFRRKIDFDGWYKRIQNKYKKKNMILITLSAMGYNFVRDNYVIYYLLGLPIIMMATNMILVYNIIALTGIMTTFLEIYSYGIFLVAFSFFGRVQSMIKTLLDDFEKDSWGLVDGE